MLLSGWCLVEWCWFEKEVNRILRDGVILYTDSVLVERVTYLNHRAFAPWHHAVSLLLS